MAHRILLSSLALLALLAGCSTPKPPAASAATAATPIRKQEAAYSEPQQTAVRKVIEASQGGGISFSPEFSALCPEVSAPRFEYDSAEVRTAWLDVMQVVASCMNDGKLRGKGLLLTGHADPRGDEDYNMVLGSRRAEAVKDALLAFHVDPARVSTSSRGEADASGSDEDSWARDRRVDVELRR